MVYNLHDYEETNVKSLNAYSFMSELSVHFDSSEVTAMTRGLKCCGCSETMYDDEMHCNWCKHRRCTKCHGFQN